MISALAEEISLFVDKNKPGVGHLLEQRKEALNK
jgi:hypothetical protein